MSFILTYDTLVEKTISYLERNGETVTNDIDAWIKFAHDRIGRDSNTQLFEVYVGDTFTAGISVMPKPARWQNTVTFNYGSGGQSVTLGNNPLETTATSTNVVVLMPSVANLIVGQTVIISGVTSLDGTLGGLPLSRFNITSTIQEIIVNPDGQAITYAIDEAAITSEVGGGSTVTAFFPTNNAYTPILLRSYEYARSFWPDQSLTGPPKFYADFGYNSWLISPTPDQNYPFQLAYLETPQVIDSTYQTNYLTEFMPEVLLKAVLLEAMLDLKNDERIPVIEQEYLKVLSSWNEKDELRKTDRYMSRKAD
jgi:hypothetical protein